MKQIFSIGFIILFSACGQSNGSKPVEQAKEIQSAIKPGTIATTTNGFTMTVKIDGEDWVATSIMPPDVAGRIIGYYNNEYIGLPYNKKDMVAGKKISLGEENTLDLLIRKTGCLWQTIKGEIAITKVDDIAAEAKFFFTSVCTASNITVEERRAITKKWGMIYKV